MKGRTDVMGGKKREREMKGGRRERGRREGGRREGKREEERREGKREEKRREEERGRGHRSEQMWAETAHFPKASCSKKATRRYVDFPGLHASIWGHAGLCLWVQRSR